TLDSVVCDRTDNDDRHYAFASCVFRYLSSNRLSLRRVSKGMVVRSVKIACSSAEPHLQERVFGISATVCRTTLHAFSAFLFRYEITVSTVTASCSGCQQS